MTPAGVAFSAAADGDLRNPTDRDRFAASVGIPADWATANQVHGADVVQAVGPGPVGDADGLVTTRPGLPIAVFTADCLGVVLHTDDAVAVGHAGWRGLAAGVLEAVIAAMPSMPERADVGPSIGPCCYEVGQEVVEAVGHPDRTTWGTTSVDLRAAAASRLRAVAPGVEISVDDRCTRCGDGLHSHRATGTSHRLAAVGWLP